MKIMNFVAYACKGKITKAVLKNFAKAVNDWNTVI